MPTPDPATLRTLPLADLVAAARAVNVENATSLRRQEVIAAILRSGNTASTSDGEGILEILADGFGFLRAAEYGYSPGADDIYVSPSQIRRFNLRTGDLVRGQVRAPRENERYFAVIKVEAINGADPEHAREKVFFDNLTAVHPRRRLLLGAGSDGNDPVRTVDQHVPLGLGQRSFVHARDRAGVATLLHAVAAGIHRNHANVNLFTLMVAERPEDVTEAQRTLPGEVAATTFDEAEARHLQVAEMVVERAKRCAEARRDAVVLFDSVNRLVRAAAGAVPASGRLVSGVDAAIIHRVRRLLAAGRSLEEGGSVTLLAVIDHDDPVSAEFAGIENHRLVLDEKGELDPARSRSERRELLEGARSSDP
ncbi:MAG: transcription termination factor Rho [Deltaproteobacteria bacterium]|nr:transcription termination factor Rho [Deltaproteobacteria bacterium]